MVTMELNEIRGRIDSVDSKIRDLLLERFDLAREVATSKMETGSKVIYRRDREDEVLDHLTDGVKEDESLLLRDIYRKIMVNSRTIQYKMLSTRYDDLLDDLEIVDYFEPDKMICQGIEGAYSHLAALKYSDVDIEFRDSFRDVFLALSGQNVGILPLDNSTQGMVSEVYDLLLLHGYYIIKSIDLPIRHVAMAKKGAKLENIKYIMAHSQALSQCSKYIEDKHFNKISATNNAVAAKYVRDNDRYDICCLGDRSNAERYGLDVVAENVSNSQVNTTRFIVVANKMCVPKSGGKVSIVFGLPHSSGTLANMLDIVASYNMSLEKIESRPIIDDKWSYIFYADIIGNIRDDDMKALLFELRSELPYLKVLGSYDELI